MASPNIKEENMNTTKRRVRKFILSEEELQHFRKLDHERVIKIAKTKPSEDINRPLFNQYGYREDLTEEEK